MFCPQCGQERMSMDTSFCSRCGFLLTGTADLLNAGGVIPHLTLPTGYKAPTPRNRGLKQGLFIFLLTFLVVPIIALISLALGLEPWGLAIASVLFFVGGLLRMAYALMFESPFPGGAGLEHSAMAGVPTLMDPTTHRGELPSEQRFAVSSYLSPASGNWRDTSDLLPNVTESTTKLLEKDEIPQ